MLPRESIDPLQFDVGMHISDNEIHSFFIHKKVNSASEKENKLIKKVDKIKVKG